MDSSGPIDDEVIADSECEMDDREEEYPNHPGILLNDTTISQVSAFTLTGQLNGNITSSISPFTTKQNSLANNPLNQLSEIDNFIGTASIAERAKTRQRNPKSSIQSSSNATTSRDNGQMEKQKSNAKFSSDIIDLSSDDDDDNLSLGPKPKARPKSKPKAKDKPRDVSKDKTLNVSGTIETSTDKSSDPIPDSRPRPRPRPLVKRSKTVHEDIIPPPLLLSPALLPSSSTSASHGPELPIATSVSFPSQLPPSDPPLPAPTNNLPRIETLPNLDFDGPLSSPSSLFSDTTKERKRTTFDIDIDELASDGDLSVGHEVGAPYEYDNGVALQVRSHMCPPPPTFFAGSSPSSTGDGGGVLPQVPSEPTREVVDLTMLPPTIVPTGPAATKKPAKTKTSRQKKGNITIMDEDELDDFDPTASTKKGKAKARPKPKLKPRAEKGEGRGQVEVSIVSKPRAQRTKGKGKEKEKATSGNKDYKSREFIDDSADEEDPMLLIPSAEDPPTSETNHTSTNGTGVHISVEPPGDEFDPEDTISSSSSNRMNKKRKFIIETDCGDEEDEKDKLIIGPSLKKHKGKQGKVDEEARNTICVNPPAAAKKGKKGKNVVWSDEDDDADEGRRKRGKVKGTRSETTPVKDASKDDKEVYTEDHEGIQGLASEAEVAKENVIPPTMKSNAKTNDKPKVENPGLFPSLHSRYEIAPRRSSLPMSELIRRANSIPGSPFATPHPRTSSSSTTKPIKSGTTTYSPYLKSSRSFLSRIAPLHANRRTPPPPPPPLPPKKKTKKELEMEEKWEEEMIDSVGISEWTCLTDDEKKDLRRAKWAKEMGDWDD